MQVYKGTIQEGGRVVIPAQLRKELTLETGSEIVFISENGNLVIRSRLQILSEAQHFFIQQTHNKSSMAEDLIKERRRESEREAKYDQ